MLDRTRQAQALLDRTELEPEAINAEILRPCLLVGADNPLSGDVRGAFGEGAAAAHLELGERPAWQRRGSRNTWRTTSSAGAPTRYKNSAAARCICARAMPVIDSSMAVRITGWLKPEVGRR